MTDTTQKDDKHIDQEVDKFLNHFFVKAAETAKAMLKINVPQKDLEIVVAQSVRDFTRQP